MGRSRQGFIVPPARLDVQSDQIENAQQHELLLDWISRVLRLVIASDSQPLVHHQLRSKALAAFHSVASSKCFVDLALVTLVDHNLLLRAGFGNWAVYSINEEAREQVMALAFREFPADHDSTQMLSYTHIPAITPCGPVHQITHTTPSSRRASPHHRMRGIDKPVLHRQRLKRSGPGEDTNQNQITSSFNTSVPTHSNALSSFLSPSKKRMKGLGGKNMNPVPSVIALANPNIAELQQQQQQQQQEAVPMSP